MTVSDLYGRRRNAAYDDQSDEGVSRQNLNARGIERDDALVVYIE